MNSLLTQRAPVLMDQRTTHPNSAFEVEFLLGLIIILAILFLVYMSILVSIH
jgi:hypothetical protein